MTIIFTGDDYTVEWKQKFYNVLLPNELGSNSPYELLWAGTPSSGYTFGVCQNDVAGNTNALNALRDILINAKDENGNYIIADNNSTTGREDDTEIARLTDLASIAPGTSLLQADKNLINQALQTTHGMQRVDETDDNQLGILLQHVDQVINLIADDYDKNFLNSSIPRLFLADFRNQYSDTANNNLVSFLQGSSVIPNSGGLPVQKDGALTVDDLLRFYFSTGYAQSITGLRDHLRRFHTVVSVAGGFNISDDENAKDIIRVYQDFIKENKDQITSLNSVSREIYNNFDNSVLSPARTKLINTYVNDKSISIDINGEVVVGKKGEEEDTLEGTDKNDLILGEEGNDTLKGKNGENVIYGGDGEDTIDGGKNTDYIYGGEDQDTINGGEGDDYIYGEGGIDIIDGGDNDDTIYGGDEGDTIKGGKGEDHILGEGGIDNIDGGEDKDFIAGGEEGDVLNGGDGDDFIYGEDGDDLIFGGKNNDTLEGGPGEDYIYGEDGHDTIIGGEGNDYLYGGDGYDIYQSGNGDTIEDSDELGHVLFNGKLLTGGYKEKGKDYYEGDGGKYYLSGNTLTFELESGESVTIENFIKENKSLGISLDEYKDKPSKDHFSSPLILDLNNNGVSSVSVFDTPAYFDLDGDGFREKTGWIEAEDGLLSLDKNANNTIDNGNELFGSYTKDKNGNYFDNGFAALSSYDINKDSIINSKDDIYNSLNVWIDSNQDGISQTDELQTLDSLHIDSINLNAQEIDDSEGLNLITHEATFVQQQVDGQGNVLTDEQGHPLTEQKSIKDVWFYRRSADTVYDFNQEIPPEVLALPDMKGAGRVKNLAHAMTEDSTLIQRVNSLLANSNASLQTFCPF